MSLLGNIVWFVFGGLISALIYWIGGIFLCLTIIGIPFGIQSFKLGLAILAPFGKDIVERPGGNNALNIIFNVIWIIFFGWEIALNHLFWAVVLGITIIGIPFALQNIKLIPLSLLPFGRDLRHAHYQEGRAV